MRVATSLPRELRSFLSMVYPLNSISFLSSFVSLTQKMLILYFVKMSSISVKCCFSSIGKRLSVGFRRLCYSSLYLILFLFSVI